MAGLGRRAFSLQLSGVLLFGRFLGLWLCLLLSSESCGVQPITVRVSKHAWGMSMPEHTYQVFMMLPR